MPIISHFLRKNAALLEKTALNDLEKEIHDKYGISIKNNPTWEQTSELQEALTQISADLIKACGIETLKFKDLGVSKEYYPNHGYYVGNTLVLNSQLSSDPSSYRDATGKLMNKFEQTLFHELGHGFDDKEGLLSDKKEWLELSGWSKEPKRGLKKVIIDEPGSPKVEGEWYFDPSAGFTRFYAKRNPWDDFADSFCYYVAGMKSFLPKEKIAYFDKKLNKFYSSNRSASMGILSSSLEKLAYSLNGHDDLLMEVNKVYENIRLAEADPAIAKQMTELLSKKDKNGVPVLFYILNSGDVDKDTATQLKSLAPNILKTQVNLEGLFGLCKKASEELNKLGFENRTDAFLIQKLAKVYHGLQTKKASLEKQALGPTPKDLEREKLLPKAVKRFISDLSNHSQTILKTKGKSGLEEFMKSYESLRKVKHEIENPKDHFEVSPTGKPHSEPVKNEDLKKVQDKVHIKDEPAKDEPAKDKPLEEKKGPGFIKRVVDRFKTKGPDKMTPDRPGKPEEKSKVEDKSKEAPKPKEDSKPVDKPNVEEKSKEDSKPAEKAEWTGPDRRKKPEETKSESKPAEKVEESKPADKSKPADVPPKGKEPSKEAPKDIEPSKDSKPSDSKKYDWKKDKKEKIKGKNWDTNYTWEDFAKLSSEEQKTVISHFDRTADRLQSFGQRKYAKQIDEVTNFLESLVEV